MWEYGTMHCNVLSLSVKVWEPYSHICKANKSLSLLYALLSPVRFSNMPKHWNSQRKPPEFILIFRQKRVRKGKKSEFQLDPSIPWLQTITEREKWGLWFQAMSQRCACFPWAHGFGLLPFPWGLRLVSSGPGKCHGASFLVAFFRQWNSFTAYVCHYVHVPKRLQCNQW